MDYIIAAKFTHPIQRLIHDCSNWIILDPRIEICEQTYQSNSWEKTRRIIIVRQRIKDRPKAPGKQLKLFLEEEIFKNYRYFSLCDQNEIATCRSLATLSWQS